METIKIKFKPNTKKDNYYKIIESLVNSINLSRLLNAPVKHIKNLEEQLSFQEEQLDKIEN